MTPDQKQLALQMLRKFERAVPMTRQAENAAVTMAAILQELVDAKEPEPAAKVLHVDGLLSNNLIDCDLPVGTLLYTAPVAPAPSVPVLTVECEPDYWSGGHYHEGTKPHIDPTAVWKLPIGTKLYTSPAAPERDLLGPADEIVKRYNAYPKLLQLISDARDELVQLSFCEDGLDELIEELTKARE